jgi:uncharacterized membrane protein YvbJ
MICKSCGTEIADKAIVCYRCGAATVDPARKPAAARPIRPASRWPSLVALVILVLLALYLGMAPTAGVPRPVSYIVAALAASLLLWRLLRRAQRR